MGDLFVEDIGSGDPVVLVHGSGPGGATWSRQRVLAERYRLLIPDRRGYGRSPRADPTFEADAQDVAVLLGDGAHLVGFSYGGIGSLLAAALRPEAVRSLTVIEPPAFGVAQEDPIVARHVSRLRAEESISRERPPWEARIPFETLAAASFPTLVVSGAWSKAFETVCGVIAVALGAERAIFSEHRGHDVQHATGFNDLLETLWRAAPVPGTAPKV